MAKIFGGSNGAQMINEYDDSTRKIDDIIKENLEKLSSLEKQMNMVIEMIENIYSVIKDIEEKIKQKESRETNASIRRYYIGKEPMKFVPSSSKNINC